MNQDQIAGNRGRKVQQLLHQQQRKKRNLTSCYPCRTRKVKCDHRHPCGNCAKRGYPDLCSTTAPETEGLRNREAVEDGNVGDRSYNLPSTSHARESSQPESSPTSHGDLPRVTPGEATPVTETPRSTYVGANSTLSFIRDSGTPREQGQTLAHSLEDALMPMLGLGLKDNSSSYPFLLSAGEFDPERALPVNHEIIRLFECYRTNVHFYTPLICDINQFEKELCAYLASRKERGSERKQAVSWLGLLLAVLGSGAQFAEMGLKRCLQKSQEYSKIGG